MPVITGDAIKYNCIKPSVPSVQEKGHRETQQTQIRRCRTQRLIRNYTVCLQEVIIEIESKWKKERKKKDTWQPLNDKWSRPIDKDGISYANMA